MTNYKEPTLRRHIILDTDIGSDVDDAMALAVILGSPQLHLEAVTTVYGDTLLRARLAQRYAGLAGRTINVAPGRQKTLSGKEVWWPGHEGSLHTDLDEQTVLEGDAIDILANTIENSEDRIDVIAIGPLTNIAALFRHHPQTAERIGHLWVMGGAFDGVKTEHNFRSDAVAAAEVFAVDVPTTVIALDVTEKIQVTGEQIAHLAAAGSLGRALLADIQQWRELWGTAWNVPHDPIAVLALTDPELFEYSPPGRVTITTMEGESVGLSTFEAGAGNTRLVTGMHVDAVSELMIERIEASERELA